MATWTGLGDNTELFWAVLSQHTLFIESDTLRFERQLSFQVLVTTGALVRRPLADDSIFTPVRTSSTVCQIKLSSLNFGKKLKLFLYSLVKDLVIFGNLRKIRLQRVNIRTCGRVKKK
jgi:hypothetical protein